MNFQHTRLANGLELIGELNPAARSVAVGFFVRTGARDEQPEHNGVSHFLEHMAFKGTPRRTAIQVNLDFDRIGARYNAFTSEENTVFWGAVLPEYLPELVDLLADILRPSLRADDFETEKQVILEEIGMYRDQPSWVAYEQVMRDHFRDHPLGNSVLGTADTVGSLRPEQMRAYYDARYVAGNICVAVAGNADWDRFCDLVGRHCQGWPSGSGQRQNRTAAGAGTFRSVVNPKVAQEHVVLVSAAPAAESPQRFAADLLATAIGDSTGSRLFWELVDPGLADSADMDYHEYNGTGAFMTYVSSAPKLAQQNLERLRRLLADATANGIRPEELEQVKNKAASRIVLRSERPMGRLMPLAFNWIYRQQYRTVQDDLDTLQAVSLDDIRQILEQYPLDRHTAVALGPLSLAADTRYCSGTEP